MAAYAIGPYLFDIWEGPAPPVSQQHLDLSVFSGFNGVQAKKVGIWGAPVQVTLTSYFATYAQAVVLSPAYFNLPNFGALAVIYENLDWAGNLGVFHLARNIQIQKIYSARVCGLGLDLPNAGVVLTSMELIPAN